MRSRRIEVSYEMYTTVRRYEKVLEDFFVDSRQGKEKTTTSV
jgi:molybdenum-dependent DNA-binding transcriptional regulator ModE